MPSSRHRLVYGGAGALLLACALLAGCGAPGVVPVQPEAPTTQPPAAEKLAVGQPCIDFSGTDLDGRPVRLSALVTEKVVLLQFWGIRCAPCLAEIEFLSGLQEMFGPKGVQVLGVNTDQVDAEKLKRALAVRNLTPNYPNVPDIDFSISKHYAPSFIPVSVLIDRKGIVRSIHTGYNPDMAKAIEADIQALVGR